MTWSATLEVAVAPSNDLIVVSLIGFGLKFSACFRQDLTLLVRDLSQRKNNISICVMWQFCSLFQSLSSVQPSVIQCVCK
jgi:hypothetical protein